MKRKSLILGVAAIVVAMFVFGAASAGLYYPEPTIITQGLDSDGNVTMTMTTNICSLWIYQSESGTIGCSLEEHRTQEARTKQEIMTNPQVTVDFYVYGVGYYPCAINRITGEITVTLTGDDVPPPGSWGALRFSGVENDTYDKTVYVVLPGTLLNEYKVPGYGDEIPLSILGWSPCGYH